jgi:hypothetical protein
MRLLELNVWKICEKCTRRNCRTTPTKKGECSKVIKMKEGFPLREMRNERSD